MSEARKPASSPVRLSPTATEKIIHLLISSAMEKEKLIEQAPEAAEAQYAPPSLEVIRMETSGVLAGSGDIPGMPGEDW